MSSVLEQKKKEFNLAKPQQGNPGEQGNNGDNGADAAAKKAAEEEEQRRIAAEKEKEQQQGNPNPATEINEDAVLKFLKEKKGFTGDKLDDFNKPAPELTEDEKRQQQADKANKVRAYGLESKLVSSKEFDDYARDSALSNYDLVLGLHVANTRAQLKAENTPEADWPTDEEIEQEFRTIYHQDSTENSRAKKTGDNLIGNIAKSYLERNYGKIINLEKEYDTHQGNAVARAAYNKALDKTMQAIGESITVPVEYKDENGNDVKTQVNFTIPGDELKRIRDTYSSEQNYGAFGQSSDSPELLAAAIRNNLHGLVLNQMVSEAYKAGAADAALKIGRGRREIPSEHGTQNKDINRGGPEAGSSHNTVLKRQLGEAKKN